VGDSDPAESLSCVSEPTPDSTSLILQKTEKTEAPQHTFSRVLSTPPLMVPWARSLLSHSGDQHLWFRPHSALPMAASCPLPPSWPLHRAPLWHPWGQSILWSTRPPHHGPMPPGLNSLNAPTKAPAASHLLPASRAASAGNGHCLLGCELSAETAFPPAGLAWHLFRVLTCHHRPHLPPHSAQASVLLGWRGVFYRTRTWTPSLSRVMPNEWLILQKHLQ
jgi:hypothetical protein